MSHELRFLRRRIESLPPATREFRERLLNCVEVAGRPQDSMNLARTVAETLVRQVLEKLHIKPATNFDNALQRLEEPRTMSRGLVPREIISMLHMLRVMGNKATHDVMHISTGTADACLVLQSALRVVEWYFAEFERGPKLSFASHDGASGAGPLPPADGRPTCFTLGDRRTDWLVIDGDGSEAYSPEEVRCRLDPAPLSLPPEIQERRRQIESREIAKGESGLPGQWNGPMVALRRYSIRRTADRERLGVTLTFSETDYFTFQATVMSLDCPMTPGGPTLRERYLPTDERCAEPVPFLAVGFGVGLAIVTQDNQLILTRRHDHVGARAGELDVSVVEGVHPVLDRATSSSGPDLYRTAIRGAAEELGIDLAADDLYFLGFGVDLKYYQWNMLGFGRSHLTAAEIVARRSRGSGGKWEARRIEFVEFELHTVLRVLRDETMWSPASCAIYWALVKEFDKQPTAAALAEVFGA